MRLRKAGKVLNLPMVEFKGFLCVPLLEAADKIAVRYRKLGLPIFKEHSGPVPEIYLVPYSEFVKVRQEFYKDDLSVGTIIIDYPAQKD